MRRSCYLIGFCAPRGLFFPLLIYTFFLNTLVSTVLQEVVFREESEKNSLGVAPRSCFGVQGGCFLSSLSEGEHSFHPLIQTDRWLLTHPASVLIMFGMLSFILHGIFSPIAASHTCLMTATHAPSAAGAYFNYSV